MNCRVKAVLRLPFLGIALLVLCAAFSGSAADLTEARRQFIAGNYHQVIKQAQQAIDEVSDEEPWQVLLSKALLETGQYAEANKVMSKVLANEPRSLQLRWQAREVLLFNGQPQAANQAVEEILRSVSRRPWDYRDANSLLVFGQAVLLHGADPKRVLDQLFDNAKKANPDLRDVYLVTGELALSKHDYALAARRFEEGLKRLPDDPDLLCGLARAYEPSHQALMLSSLDSALEQNTNHVPSLLLLAEYQIDAEDYGEAEKLLDRVFAVNPWHPDGWAYRAVVAHLQNRPEDETAAREKALKFWTSNPRVDHLIGRKLSQKYRFAEGAARQRQALQFDAAFLPAKAQLAQDLLRLGEESEGWELAEQVQKQDAYDVAAFNLVGLHETMGKFTSLTNQDFIVRMSSREASIYGSRVMQLLGQAKSNLCTKYGMQLEQPTIVEIFPSQKDFAVRTFGMPGNPGYLGVCFGRVVTANSPASRTAEPVNWESVLWHEFCHVVTLQMTRNKMPRWLSEGISVYEETQANRAWGQHMGPRYREMILGGDLTPLSKLSGAFLAPPSELHLQFAYYESSLVVDFLLAKFGLAPLKALLADLAGGVEINQGLEKHFGPMSEIEPAFEAFARERAEKLAPGLDWEKPPFVADREEGSRRPGPPSPIVRPRVRPENLEQQWADWTEARPTNYWALSRKAEQLVVKKDWPAAKPVLQTLIELYPESIGPDSAYALLAQAHRALGETDAERKVLARLAERDDEAIEVYLRLMELGAVAGDWPEVASNARRYLAVNPLVAPPYRFLADAGEKASDMPSAIAACRALLQLEPSDPAEVHFRLARLLHRTNDPGAKRHLLEALEEAPRYRDALRLLLQLSQPPGPKVSAAAEPKPDS